VTKPITPPPRRARETEPGPPPAAESFPQKIVSGGQTGVDRAALDVALQLAIPCGGWCPKGRLAEDGVIAERYPLTETASADADERTRLNVRDADATLILNSGPLAGGTRRTAELAGDMARPHLVVNLDDAASTPAAAAAWLARVRPQTLNVAGPRASKAPGVHEKAAAYLRALLALTRST